MNSLFKKKQELQNLLAKNGALQAIYALKAFVLEGCERYRTLLLIEGQLKELRKREQQDIDHPSDIRREKNRIRKDLIDFIYDLEDFDCSFFIDPRDGQVYKTVKLFGKTWMAQNLNFDVGEGSYFYDNDIKHNKEYGRLYTCEAAMKASPQGWRLPTDEEWKYLAVYSGGITSFGDDFGDPHRSYNELTLGGSSGFNALLGGKGFGSKILSLFNFSDLETTGHYWSSLEESFAENAWSYSFYREDGKLYRDYTPKSHFLSVRCVEG